MNSAGDRLSRWLMRTMEAGRVLQIPLLGVTAVSTLTTALKGTFLEPYTIHIIGAFGLGGIVFIWAYDEFQILNRQNRDKQDRADNFVGPGMTMNSLIQARQLAIAVAAVERGEDFEDICREMEDDTLTQLREWRDGIDIEAVYDDTRQHPTTPPRRTVADGGNRQSGTKEQDH